MTPKLESAEYVSRYTIHVWFADGTEGVVWKPPYAVDVTGRLRTGDDELRVEVANTRHDRLVGDAALPPAERITTTNVRRPFTQQTPLVESGLLGPVWLVPFEDFDSYLHAT